jgi:hypothetical protein
MRGLLLRIISMGFVAGCGCGEIGIEGRVDPAIDGASDEVLEHDPEVELTEDMSWEPGPDLEPDTGDDSCYPSTWRGECSIIDGCGCPTDYGWICSLYILESECRVFERCVDLSDVSLGDVGDACLTHQYCQEGLICVSREGNLYSPGTCHEMCKTDRDCSVPGQTCSYYTSTFPPSLPCADVPSPDTRSITVCAFE